LRLAGPVALVVLVAGCSFLLDFDAPLDAADAGSPDGLPDGADFAEPNDTFATAYVIGSGTKSGLSIAPRGDEDFYRFTLATPRDLVVILRFTQATGDLDLELYDSAQQRIGASTGNDDDEEIARTEALANQLAAGDYYIRVFGFDGQYTNDYSLEIQVP
jgi:Bacterial pre-peptidase C-terminal domain